MNQHENLFHQQKRKHSVTVPNYWYSEVYAFIPSFLFAFLIRNLTARNPRKLRKQHKVFQRRLQIQYLVSRMNRNLKKRINWKIKQKQEVIHPILVILMQTPNQRVLRRQAPPQAPTLNPPLKKAVKEMVRRMKKKMTMIMKMMVGLRRE